MHVVDLASVKSHVRKVFEGTTAVLYIALVGWYCDFIVTAFSVPEDHEALDITTAGETNRSPVQSRLEPGALALVSREERQNMPDGFQVFARVEGKTLVVQVWEDMLVSELRALVARRLHASPDQCYVTKGGKLLSLLSSVREVGLVKGSAVELHARGVGGAIPGEWYCNHCQRSGCWPARQHCFRRGMARDDGGFGKGGKAKGKGGAPQRETSYPAKKSAPCCHNACWQRMVFQT